ncbi:MAG: PEP-CTERM sorting domain-containing protein [Armatimonadetes bacterium]|nr:PEP-CTERM sorting domain-containing protein [Armatimonadota bacterium]
MLNPKAALIFCSAILSTFAHAVVVGYDDTSDPAYSSGWTALSNGGFGFGPWYFSSVSTNGLGDSNTNGSSGGPGINVAGKSWKSQQGIGWNGAMVSRNIGNFAVGNLFEIDVDFGDLPTGVQAISLFDSALTDFLQVRSSGGTGLMTIQSTYNFITTSVPYSDGGFRLGFAYTSGTNINVSITSLATSVTSTYAVSYTGVAGSHELSIGGNNPVPGQEIYTNRLVMNSPVPEPMSILALSLGMACVRKRRR